MNSVEKLEILYFQSLFLSKMNQEIYLLCTPDRKKAP